MKQRKFSVITIIDVVRELQNEGLPRFNRIAFYRMFKKHKWPVPPRNSSGWRVFGSAEPEKNPETPYSVPYYKALIRNANGLPTEVPERPAGLMDYEEAEQKGLLDDIK